MSYQDLLTADVQLQHEVEDEISLCDFPLYSHAADSWDPHEDFERDQELFQFFTQDLSASESACPAENIIFCGKVFSRKESSNTDNSTLPDEANKRIHSKKKSLFKCGSNKSQKGSGWSKLKNANKSDISLQKATMLAAPIKSYKKYYATVLGLTKMPIAMQLGDIKTRQSRQNPTSISALFEDPQMVTINKSGGRWLWRLLKALGVDYRTGRADAAVKATFGCLWGN